MNKFAVKAWRDYHGVPTLFLVIDEDDCELGRFLSEAEAVSNAAVLEEESRFLQELGAAAARTSSQGIGTFSKACPCSGVSAF